MTYPVIENSMNRDGGAKPKFLKQQFVKSLASIPKQLQIANVCQKVNKQLRLLVSVGLSIPAG
jgi:hypothetical protein